MSEKIIVRQMTLDDLYDVIRIANMSFPFTGRRPSVVGPYIIGRLYYDPKFQFVALMNGRIAGFITCKREDGRKAELTYIAVHPGYRGRGVGRALVRKLEETLKNHGYEYIWLVTQPMAKNFYIKLGYEVFKILYKVGIEILDKVIEKPNFEIKYTSLDEIIKIAKSVSDWNVLLTYFVRVYEREPDKALIVKSNGRLIGVVIGETDEYNKDFLIVRYVYSESGELEDYMKLLEAMKYVASLKGYRWIGYATENVNLVDKLKKDGWIENPLPTFMHTIYMHKYL